MILHGNYYTKAVIFQSIILITVELFLVFKTSKDTFLVFKDDELMWKISLFHFFT